MILKNMSVIISFFTFMLLIYIVTPLETTQILKLQEKIDLNFKT